jgi:NAD(P)-dependent dehydrogenase (short-subunit alcohol dehydrogenase family)
MELSGKVALVTGANRGLGAVFVDGLVARGATVYAAARNQESVAPIVARYGGCVIPLELDVTDPPAIASATATAGDVNLLVNNAGRLEQLGLAEAGGLDPLRAEMEVNVFGLAQMSLAFAPVIARNGGGAIVNMLSVASLLPFAPFASYSASKAAAMSLTHSMRWDFHKLGVQVFGIYAGFIDTGMVSNVVADKATPQMIVERALSGIEADELDIAADDRSTEVREQLQHGLEGLLKESYERADLFRINHPALRPD